MYLLLDLPEMPLFKDGEEEKFIPQTSLQQLLVKFDGQESQQMKDGSKRSMRLTKLPPYLIIAFRRFSDGYFSVEKNTTIVNCGIKGLDMKNYMMRPDEQSAFLETMSCADLEKRLKRLGGDPIKCQKNTEELIQAIAEIERKKFINLKSKYDLIGNLCHDGGWREGTNKSFVINTPNDQWYDMHDLHVRETIPQLVSVAESYIQIWRRRKDNKKAFS